jgi:hypothetical protein
MNNGHFFEYQKWLLYTGFTVVIKENDDGSNFMRSKLPFFMRSKLPFFMRSK